MEEVPVETPVGHNTTSPEARRRQALVDRGKLQAQFARNLGPASRFWTVVKRVAVGAKIPASRTTKWLGEHNINVSLWHSVGQFLITAAPILGSAFLAGLGKGK